MARKPNKKAVEAKRLYHTGMKLVDIADRLEVPAGTVRRWKSTYHWDEDKNEQKKKQSERSDKKKANVRKENQQKSKAIADEVKEVMQNTDLTDKQRLFCIYYIRRFNATKAYQKAYGVDYATAVVNGPRMLGNARVKEEIYQLKQERLNREFLSEADIFQKYMDIAFADITDFSEFGNKDIEVINPNTGVHEEITVSYVNFKGSNEVDGTLISEVSKGKDGIKVKLADRMKALQWLSDHMDLATEEQKARIAVLKAKVEMNTGEEGSDDGFIEALNASAEEDWSDEEADKAGISF